ncbi:VanZ family protein [Pseudidiomarina sp. PP-1MA]|uniref:VanZ family protein n=1 Tax=Pseudidiomarina sp. PP-1MA TaxID=3237706 RepID=A0AB39X5F0_9GAMM
MTTKLVVARIVFVMVLIALSMAFLMQVSTGGIPRFEHADKVVHFAAFFVLALTFHRAFPIPIGAALVVLTLYGLAIEWAQHLLPYRSASAGDLLADAAGAVSYYGLFWWRFERKRKRNQQVSS